MMPVLSSIVFCSRNKGEAGFGRYARPISCPAPVRYIGYEALAVVLVVHRSLEQI